MFPKDPSADVLATQLFPPGPSLTDPCSSRKGEAPLLAGAGPSLKDKGGLALVRPLDGGPSWITIEPRPLLYWASVCWWKSLEMFSFNSNSRDTVHAPQDGSPVPPHKKYPLLSFAENFSLKMRLRLYVGTFKQIETSPFLPLST